MTKLSIRHAISPIVGLLVMGQNGTLNAAAPNADVLAMLSQDRDATIEGQSDAASSGSPTAPVSSVVYGAAGSRRWFIGGVVGSDLGDEKMAFLSGGVEWFAIDDFSIGVEADLGWVGQDAGADAGLFGLTIMMRWHFLRYERWTVYGEIGAGLAYSSEPVRPTGGQLNFTPQRRSVSRWTSIIRRGSWWGSAGITSRTLERHRRTSGRRGGVDGSDQSSILKHPIQHASGSV